MNKDKRIRNNTTRIEESWNWCMTLQSAVNVERRRREDLENRIEELAIEIGELKKYCCTLEGKIHARSG